MELSLFFFFSWIGSYGALCLARCIIWEKNNYHDIRSVVNPEDFVRHVWIRTIFLNDNFLDLIGGIIGWTRLPLEKGWEWCAIRTTFSSALQTFCQHIDHKIRVRLSAPYHMLIHLISRIPHTSKISKNIGQDCLHHITCWCIWYPTHSTMYL